MGHQGLAAFFFGGVGLLSVVGPMTFVHVSKTILGSLVAGGLFASLYGYLFHGAGEAPWADALGAIIGGNASGVEVVIIWIFVGAGMLRWYFGWEWLLYAVVDELYLSRPVADAYIREPLLPKPQSTSEAQPAVASGAAKQDTSRTGQTSEQEYGAGRQVANAKPDAVAGKERVIDVVQRALLCEKDSEQLRRLWTNISKELARGDVPEQVVALLVSFGFDPQHPEAGRILSKSDLRSLEDMLHQIADTEGGGQWAGYSFGQSAAGVGAGAPQTDEV